MSLEESKKGIRQLKKFMKAWDEKNAPSKKEIKLSPPQKKFLEWFDEYLSNHDIVGPNIDRINKNSNITITQSDLKKLIPEIVEHEKYLSSFRTILNNIREVYGQTYKLYN